MHPKLAAVEETLLMGPGPSCVHPDVYAALARPTIGHLDPAFIAIMDECKELLQQLLNTKNELAIPISGTGSAGMEAAFANLVERGDRVLILINGVFGMRMADVAGRLGAEVDTLEFEWGTPVITETVKAKLEEENYAIVAIVHAETSTGVRNPMEEIADLVRPTDALFLVDTVTGLGGIPVEVDAWDVDALYSGTQKCLSCPPGLAPFTLSARALEKLGSRKTKVPNWYLDISLITGYWGGGAQRAYHHTAPINMIYAFLAALNAIIEEGIDKVHARHRETHEQLVAGLEGLGLEMLVETESRLPMLNSVRVPEGVDEAAVRTSLLNDHRIEIGAGLGPLAGKIWRIGLMGHTARSENVDRLLSALRSIL